MKRLPFVAGMLLACGLTLAWGDIQTDWAFHSAGSGDRLSLTVPGEPFFFLANGSDQIPNSETVTLYVLTAEDFAGPLQEEVFVRWWDGARSHWILGRKEKTLELSAAEDRRIHGLPAAGTQRVDLWKIEVPEWVTQPGDNFYAIQLKAFGADGEMTAERYLLCRPGGDFTHVNNLGQIWSSSEEFAGQDWKVTILP